MTSNGYDHIQAFNALKARRGWEQPTLANLPTLDTATKECLSGRYYEEAHEACKINILHKTQEDFAISDANFIACLNKLERGVVNDTLTSVLTKPQVIDQPQMLFEKVEQTTDSTVTSSGKFVGVKINLSKGNYAAQLHSVALLFDGVATFNVHLYSDLKLAPLWSTEVTTVANDLTIVSFTDKVLRPIDASTKGGTFYFGYFQDDLGDVKAVDHGVKCENCFRPLGFDFFEATASGSNFDRNTYARTSVNFGLNLQVSTYYDYTQTIVSRAYEFDSLLGLKMAARCIELDNASIRINSTERAIKEQATEWYRELHQNVATEGLPFSESIEKKIAKEIKRLQDSFYPKDKNIISVPCH